MHYDLIIIGGGPAGVAAGVYACRKRLKTLLIAESWGGQSIVSEGIENWIGTVKIPGAQLAEDLKQHLLAYASDVLTVKEGVRVEKIEKLADGKILVHAGGEAHNGTAVLIATGSTRRRLDVPGADEFEHKGVTYCASCDGPIFAGQDVAVIGGGNAAFETAAQLLAYAKSVTLLNRSGSFRADPVTVQAILSRPNMTAVMNATPVRVEGSRFVEKLVWRDEAHTEHTLSVGGIFVEIGLIPTTGFAEGVVDMNEIKQIIVDPRTQRTSAPGIWAAGDCTDGLYHQNNIAAGDAVKALEDIYIAIASKPAA
jgi:alkyl hydroperoxide reductase subunit F